MSKLDKRCRMVLEGLKKVDQNSQEIHAMAEKLLTRIEELRRETIATRERTRSARSKAEARSEDSP